MIQFICYYICVLFLILSLLHIPSTFPARILPDHHPSTKLTVDLQDDDHNNKWHDFARFLDAGKGSHVPGMSRLKNYFHHFGYFPTTTAVSTTTAAANFTDLFDESFELAVRTYQERLGLSVTGYLDSDTMSEITSPRCGVGDMEKADNKGHKLRGTKRYAYFYGEPRWARPDPVTLTYAFSPEYPIKSVPLPDAKEAFRRSFARWSAVIPVNFTESDGYGSADIKIGFFRGDHGDGEPFDGALGVLAHAFSPENGRLHLDAAERWAVDFGSEGSRVAVDLESVVTHEIGHVLGLAHSSVKEAVMYPSLRPRTRKVDLRIDDVEGAQALYGSNPNFHYNSLLESDISSSSSTWALGSHWWPTHLALLGFLLFFFFFCS